MSVEKIKVFPEITTIVIENDKVISITQKYNDIDKIKTHIQTCIETVRKYDKSGYYNLSKPEFASEVITTFTNLELSKKDVIRINNFVDIQGVQACHRVWQLPDELKVQISQMLHGFTITYDSVVWEDFSVDPLQN